MNTSRFGKLVLATAACLFMAACGNSSGSNGGTLAAPVEPSEVGSSELASSGSAVATSDVSGVEARAGQVSEGETARSLEEIYAAYPVLATRASFLGSVTRVVETDAGTLDMYAGEALVMTLMWNAETSMYTVGNNTSGFAADSIVRTLSDSQQVQDNVLEKLNFVTSACRTEEQEQEQEQEQKQQAPKQQEEQEQEQEQKQQTPKQQEEQKQQAPKQQEEQEQEQKQQAPKQEEQKQEEPKEEPKQELCASIEIEMTLTRQEEKQEEQKQEEPKQEEEQKQQAPKQEEEQKQQAPKQEEEQKQQAPKQEQEQEQDDKNQGQQGEG